MLIRWTRAAVADLRDICDFTEGTFGVPQARRAAIAIDNSVDSLRDMPHLGRFGRKPGTRELPITGLPFIVIYRDRRDAVEIVRILHGTQKWP